MLNKFTIFTLLILFISACSSEPKTNLKPLDLLSYGIPITIMAPDSADIKTMDFVGVKDVSIKSGNDFYVQVFSSEASTVDVKKVKMNQKRDVENNPYFSKFVKEDDTGFIYEMALDSAQYNYGFCHIRIQGDSEYVFQTGLIGIFSLEEVEKMYGAVQPVAMK